MVQTKKCSKCSEVKPLDEYSPHKKRPYGKQPRCKICRSKSEVIRGRTKDGLITKIYSGQRESSKKRKHPSPTYALTELREWALKQSIYHELHAKWVESGYDKMKTPSCDRKDDYKGYSFDNIQITTWRENRNKLFEDKRNGINNKQSKPVSQHTKDGAFIQTFHSMNHAGRTIGVSVPHICQCCSGERRIAGGFIWKYADE